MTFKEIYDEVGARIGDTSTSTVARTKSIINDVIQGMSLHLASEVRQGILRTTSGRMRYGLHPDAGQLLNPWHDMEQQTVIDEVDGMIFDGHVVRPAASGTPTMYTLRERAGISRQPASKLRLVSDSTSDTQAVTVYGLVDGQATSESVTMTGNVSTGVLTTNDYQDVTQSPVAASAAVGTITVTSNSTAANSALPTTTVAGLITVCTITAGNTISTDLQSPGSVVRIKMAADNGTDDRSKIVRVEGESFFDNENYDGVVRRNDITTHASDATTEVQSGKKFTKIYNVTKEWDSTDTLLVMVDPGARIVAVIPQEVRSMSFQYVDLYPIPIGSSIRYPYRPRFTPLVEEGDTPPYDPQYHRIVLKWAYKLAQGFKGDFTGDVDYSTNPEFLQDIAQVQRSMDVVSNTPVVVGGGRPIRRSRSDRGFPILDPAHYRNR